WCARASCGRGAERGGRRERALASEPWAWCAGASCGRGAERGGRRERALASEPWAWCARASCGRGAERGGRMSIRRWDDRVMARVAGTDSPVLDRVLPRLSRAADHGMLWFAVAGVLAASGRRPFRRAALRGTGSLAVASATVNVAAKGLARRTRPETEGIPLIRRLRRAPITTSFPSGHSASAAAFATAVALEAPAL